MGGYGSEAAVFPLVSRASPTPTWVPVEQFGCTPQPLPPQQQRQARGVFDRSYKHDFLNYVLCLHGVAFESTF